MGAVTPSSRRRGPRRDVSLELILDAAESLLHSDGPEALTLRAVAHAAGVSPNAIYTYVTDMADLRNRLGDDFLGRFDLSLLTEGGPTEALRAFLDQVLAIIHASPHHVSLLASRRIVGRHSLALNEALLEFCIDRAGLTAPEAAAATQLLTEWVHGHSRLASSTPDTDGAGPAEDQIGLQDFPLTRQMLALPEDDLVLDLVTDAIIRKGSRS